MKGLGGVQGNPGRFVLSVLAVVLGVSFMSGAFFVQSSMVSTVGGVVATISGADVYVQPTDSSVADVLLKSSAQQSFLDSPTTAQISNANVTGVQYLLTYVGAVVLMGKDAVPVSSGLAPSVGLGADPNEIETGRLVDGVLPASIKEIALEQHTADKAGFVVGDEATVIANGTTLDVTVSGIVSYDSSLGGAVVVIFNGIAARAIFSPSGMIPFAAVKAGDDSSPEQLRDAVATALSAESGVEVNLGSQVRSQAKSEISKSLGQLNVALLFVGVVMVLVGGFLVVNTFASAERAHAEEVASMKSIGASTGEVLKPVFLQGLIVGAIGSVIGIVVGFGLFMVLKAILAGRGLDLAVSVPWLGLAISLVVGVIVTVICAWLGARKTASMSLMESIEGSRARTGVGVVRVVAGAVLFVAGIAGMVLGHQNNGNLWLVGGGVAAVLVGVVLLGPVLVALLARLFAYPLRLFSSVSAVLAKGNIVRTPRRAANIAGVFIVAMALATGTLVLSSSANASVESKLSDEVKADLVLEPEGAGGFIPDSVVAQVRQVPDAQVTTFGPAPLTMVIPDKNDPDDRSKDTVVDANILFGPQDVFSTVAGTTILEGKTDDFASGLAVTKSFADAQGLHLGDTVTFLVARNTPYEQAETITVALILDSDLFKDMMVSSTWLIQQIPGHTRSQFLPVTLMFVTASNPGLVDTVQEQVTATVDPYQTISVHTKDEFASAPDPQVTQARTAAYALVVLCVIVAILALVNALNTAVAERTREVGVLKTIGASRGQIRNVFSFESVLICAAGSLIGIVLGIGLAFAGRYALPGLGVTSLTFPWVWLVGFFVLSIVVGFVAPIGPAGRASKQSVVGALA